MILNQTYNYKDETKNVEEKRLRIKAQKFILRTFDSESCVEKLVQPNLEILIEMIENNIFRPLEPV